MLDPYEHIDIFELRRVAMDNYLKAALSVEQLKGSLCAKQKRLPVLDGTFFCIGKRKRFLLCSEKSGSGEITCGNPSLISVIAAISKN